ncbi:hypothetical protein MP638_000873 [Amoeboaphelidium occidentale]|nr:hypothetical protein MP638_000873 [Amoeboaphelidium occidentale]
MKLISFLALIVAAQSVLAQNHNDAFLRQTYGEGYPLKYVDQVVLPLTTKGQHIVDQLGNRVKLACVNWAAHMESLLPEGLADNTPKFYAKFIRQTGFNCVRFTFSGDFVDMRGMALGLTQARVDNSERGITEDDFQSVLRVNNYTSNTPLRQVLYDTMNALKEENIFVILDNHVSKATWCCPLFDGNRFWGDKWFEVESWLRQLRMATEMVRQNGWTNVIGIGLRNEVFTLTRWNAEDLWFQFMRMGAQEVHAVDKNMLLIVGGLRFASKFTQLRREPLFSKTSSISQQVVYEFHFYNRFYVRFFWPILRWSGTCALMKTFLHYYVGFILDDDQAEYYGPIFASEFGFDFDTFKRGHIDHDWLNCLEHFIGKERDLDFGVWQLHGKYYFRLGEGYKSFDTFGVLNNQNDGVRSQFALDSISNLLRVHTGRNIDRVIIKEQVLE